MSQISGLDDFFLHFERTGLPMHVGSVAVYQPSASRGGPAFDQILESIRRGVSRAPVLRKRLVATPLHLDRPCWVDDRDLDVVDHVRRMSRPSPATWPQLCSDIAQIFEEPLDLARPLFEVTVIEDLGGIAELPAGSFALVTKVHHAVLDGISGVEVMRAFSDASADFDEIELGIEEPEPESSAASLIGRLLVNQVDRGLAVARLTATSLRMLANDPPRSAGPESSGSESKSVPHTRFNSRPTASRVFGGCHLNLSAVQAVRNAVAGATVNDVILTVVGGALRRLLDEHGELPETSVTALAPISVRTAEEASGSGESGGNRISMMVVGLGTDVASPLERLDAVHRRARTSKKSSSAAGSNTLLDVSNVIPSALGELAARAYRGLGLSSLHPSFFSCVVTNVPGPREPLFLAGAQMVACYGLGPIFDGVGLIHPVLSYDGGITISFTSCPKMLPDPARYEACLYESFEELVEAAGVHGTTDLAVTGRRTP